MATSSRSGPSVRTRRSARSAPSATMNDRTSTTWLDKPRPTCCSSPRTKSEAPAPAGAFVVLRPNRAALEKAPHRVGCTRAPPPASLVPLLQRRDQPELHACIETGNWLGFGAYGQDGEGASPRPLQVLPRMVLAQEREGRNAADVLKDLPTFTKWERSATSPA